MPNATPLPQILYILVGTPGSGKSTYVKNHLPPEAVVCSADHWFERSGEYRFDPKELHVAHMSCQRRVEAAMMGRHKAVVVDNTSTRHRERRPYLDLAQEYGYLAKIVVLPAPPENRNIHGVPWEKVQEMQARIELSPGIYVFHNGTYVREGDV